MKCCFPCAWLTWMRRRCVCWLKSFLWVGVPRCVLYPTWIRQHHIKAEHNMAVFSPAEVGHLSSTSACLLKPWGNLLFLRLLPSIKFIWSWIIDWKVARHIHAGMHTVQGSMKSTFLQQVLLRPLRIKFWGSEKDGFRGADQQITWINPNPLRIPAAEKVLREGQSLKKEDEDKNMFLERV